MNYTVKAETVEEAEEIGWDFFKTDLARTCADNLDKMFDVLVNEEMRE